MNRAAEQVVRDYLHRVSAASHGRLSPAERRALLAGVRLSVDRAAKSGAGEVRDLRRLFAAIGEPGVLVTRYRATLAARAPAPGQDGRAGADPPGDPDQPGQAAQPANAREPRFRSASGSWRPPPPRQPADPAAPEPVPGPGPAAGSGPGAGFSPPAASGPAGGFGSPAAGPGPAGPPRHVRDIAADAVRQHPVELSAVVLLGLGVIIFPPIWLIGAGVALASKVWDRRDKWAGLLGPVALVVIATWAVATADGGHHHTFGAYAYSAWLIAGRLSRAAGLLGALYLAWRLTQEPRVKAPPWHRTQTG